MKDKDVPTFYVKNADLSKEVAVTKYSILGNPIICHHSQLSLFNDVHLTPYITFSTHILSRIVKLQNEIKNTITKQINFQRKSFFIVSFKF